MRNEPSRGIYSECKKTLLETKWYILFSLAVFCFFFLLGFTLPIFFREEIFKLLSTITNTFEGKGLIQVIAMIFYNNAKASLTVIVLGSLFGLVPLAALIFNGYLVGFTGRLASEREGLSVMLKLFPHGIFELPAILISMGLGLKLGLILLKGGKDFKKEFKKAIKFYIFVVIPLLIIAAIIEGFLVYFVD